MEKTKNKTYTLEDLGIEKDSGYVLIIHNDNVTPFEYVIYVLADICGLTISSATEVAMRAHTEGKAVVNCYDSKEEAEDMEKEIIHMNSISGHNLKTSIEEE